jgi:hypothetical protein
LVFDKPTVYSGRGEPTLLCNHFANDSAAKFRKRSMSGNNKTAGAKHLAAALDLVQIFLPLTY